MIRNQQQLRDRTWREGREQRDRQRRGEAGPNPPSRGQADPGRQLGELQQQPGSPAPPA